MKTNTKLKYKIQCIPIVKGGNSKLINKISSCPYCGQNKYPISKHNLCTICRRQTDDMVVYERYNTTLNVKELHEHYPSFNMSDEFFEEKEK